MPTINKPKRKDNPNTKLDRKKRQKIYNSTLWEKMRTAKLMESPLCQVCEMEGRITAAIDVHHLVTFTKFNGNELTATAYDYANLVAVCKVCHTRIHHGDLYGCTTLEEIAERLQSLSIDTNINPNG